MSFVQGPRRTGRLDGMGAIAFRDPIAGRRLRAPRVGLRGLGSNIGTQIGAGAAATGATFAAGSAIAAGAAFGSVVPVVGTAIGALVGLASTFIGGGTPDQMKGIWNAVGTSLTRLQGGHGTWTDQLTRETMGDAGSDLRKSAVVASAIGAFNDQKNFWYDAATQQYLSGASALQRWQAKFGSLSFANAYAAYPAAFTIYSPVTSSGDPQIHSPNAAVVYTPPNAIGPVVGNPLVPTVPYTNVNATPGAVANAPYPVAQASILGGLSGSTLAIIGGGLLVGLLLFPRRRGQS